MKTKFKKINLIITICGLAILFAIPVFAQTSDVSTIISKANTEINQRITSLNDLISRIGLMKKLSASQQDSLTSAVQNEINDLISLKTKINADTDKATAKTDYQSITKSYRVYALVLPQVRIMAASDKTLTIADSMNALGTKVQSRISALPATDTTEMNQLFSDFNAKVSDAISQANSAISEISALVPDQGEESVKQSNSKALKSARTKIKTANSDLVEARKDLKNIIEDLKNSQKPAQ